MNCLVQSQILNSRKEKEKGMESRRVPILWFDLKITSGTCFANRKISCGPWNEPGNFSFRSATSMIYKIADRHNIYHRNGPFVYQFNCLSVKTRKSRNLKLSPETTLITNLPLFTKLSWCTLACDLWWKSFDHFQ